MTNRRGLIGVQLDVHRTDKTSGICPGCAAAGREYLLGWPRRRRPEPGAETLERADYICPRCGRRWTERHVITWFPPEELQPMDEDKR